MADSPVTPEEICAAVPRPTDPVCVGFRKVFVELPVLLCKLLEWAIPRLEDGGIVPGEGLAAPTNLTATQDQEEFIRLTWSAVSGATSYEIWRGSNSNTAEMTRIVESESDTTYDDTGAPINTVTWYAVKAKDATRTSAFSNVASGLRPEEEEPDVPPPINHGDPSVKPITVSAGVETMELWMWGSGGSGGAIPPFTPIGTPPFPYGGGGASGSFVRITGIEVEEGEVYQLKPGDPRSGGDPTTYVYKTTVGADEYAWATPGGPGGQVSGGQGQGGQPASDPGGNNLGTGTVEGETTVGNAGTTGSQGVVGAGGAGVTHGGLTKAAGQTGINVGGSNGNPAGSGQYGFIRVTWHA